MIRWLMVLFVVLLTGLAARHAVSRAGGATGIGYYHAPAWNDYARIDAAGTTILPNGRLLRPHGKLLWTPMNTYAARFGPDGAAFCAAEDGSVLIARNLEAAAPSEQRLQVKGSFPVLAIGPEGTLYLGGGDDGVIRRLRPGETAPSASWPLNGDGFRDSVASDLAVSPDGATLFAADVTNFRVVAFDTRSGARLASVPVGRYPYALALSADGRRLWVANIGMFQYTRVPPPADPNSRFDRRGLTRPAYGFPSREAEEGVEFEGRRVAGLGAPNVPESFSVWGLDVSDPGKARVVSRIKTGALVDSPYENGKTVGGSGPNSLCVSGSRLYVSNGNNDTIDVVDTAAERVVGTVRLRPVSELFRCRGVTPYGLAVSPDGRRLYACEAGLNAVAVIDAERRSVLGHIPTAWYPTAVDVSDDGRTLIVACAKGLGWGPRDDRIPRRPEQQRFGNLPGCMLAIPVPSDQELASLTQEVARNNGLIPDPQRLRALPPGPISPLPGRPSRQMKYVVFITKENHTYDGILGALPGAKGDPALCWWGAPYKIGPHEGVVTMPNHAKLAREFAHSDNFYMEPEASGDGHRWLVGAYPNVWCQRLFEQGYGFNADSPAPGRLAAFGSNGSLQPEDYLESGCLWEHLARGGITFRNYGEGFELAGQLEEPGTKLTGSVLPVNLPMPKPLFDNTCWTFPAYNNNIPDQYRADQFIKDLTARPLPRFINVAICNDHGAGPRPDTGFPYSASYLADNDLALGRIVEYLTHRPEWKEMAIFVTQDDSGGDPDHVDRHRSICLVLSPWAKRRHVSHRHTSVSSILKTIYLIFGLPPCNLYDATATDLTDAFTTKPDFTPYRHVGVDPRIFDPAKARDPGDPDYRLARLRSSIALDDPRFTHHLRPDADEDDD